MSGRVVRVRRTRLGLSQEELAGRAGVDVKTISNIEAGRTTPRLSTVRLLADALELDGTERDDFFARISAGAAGTAPARPVLPPAQLPSAVAGFTGRVAQLAALDSLVAAREGDRPAAVVISAVWGTAGVGKTALAVHWAHRVRGQFPDGQLYVNLRGFDPTGQAVNPGEAVRRFLDALQLPTGLIPADPEAQTALYRTVLADRRMLIVLDNARDADQVRPLLPGAPGCLVLVTSRNQLTSLVAAEGAHPVLLDLLTVDEARELLARRLGLTRVAAEPGAVDEIITRCTRLPLALAVVAARAATRVHIPLAGLAADLGDAHRRLDALHAGDATTDVRAVFSWSYRSLGPAAARLFRLLGLFPGSTFTAATAAALSGRSLAATTAAIEELRGSHLVEQPGRDRFRLHDLLRLYARERCDAEEDQAARGESTQRLADWYLAAATAVNTALTPRRTRVVPVLSFPRPDLPVPATGEEALVWPDGERHNLVAFVRQAAQAGPHDAAWQIPYLLWGYFAHHGQWADCVAMHRAAVAAAPRCPDPDAEVISRGNMALALGYLRQLDEAMEQQQLILRRCQASGRIDLQAVSLGSIAFVHDARREYDDAAVALRQSIELAEAAGDRVQRTMGLINLGQVTAKLGKEDEAYELLVSALDLARQIGDAALEAYTLNHLGEVYLGRDDRAAADYYEQAATRLRTLDDRGYEATARSGLGQANLNLGRPAAALRCFRRALVLRRQTGEVHEQADILLDIARTALLTGEVGDARRALNEAVTLRRHLPDEPDDARVDNLLAHLDGQR